MRQITIYTMILFSLFLGLHRGQIALLDTESNKPITVYQKLAVTLPRQDQIALASGIPIRSEIHLAQLLEDYLS